MSVLLFREIARLFLIMFMGFAVVKAKLLRSEDSRVLTVLLVYLVSPCVIIHSFQMDYTEETLQMMLLSFLASITINTLAVVLGSLVSRASRLDRVETASVIYANAGNLTIPLVSAVLGKEWVMFVAIYFMVQTAFLWTHGRALVSGEKTASLRSLFGNINVLAIFVGLILFFARIRLPFLNGALEAVGDMVGPTAMLIIGMLLADVTVSDLRRYGNLWKVCTLRLVVLPLLWVLLAKYSGAAALAPNGETILLISLLSAITPSANLVTQFCQLFGQDAKYSGVINIVTMLLCIVTMPLLVALYQA